VSALPTLESVAHHEVGHALVALAVWRRVARVTIVATGDALGHMRNDWSPTDSLEFLAAAAESGDPLTRHWARTAAIHRVMVAAAGEVAESMHTGVRLWSPSPFYTSFEPSRPYPATYGDDERNASVALCIAATGRFMASFGYAKRAERMLRAHLTPRRGVLADLAGLLLSEHTVDGESFEAAAKASAIRHGVDLRGDELSRSWWATPRTKALTAKAGAT
jgi:hypothetical protein